MREQSIEIIQDQDFEYLDYIKSMDTAERKRFIRSNMVSSDFTLGMMRNELILFESRPVLQRRGQYVNVTAGNSNKPASYGLCYYNSITSLSRGFKYVEGFVRIKGRRAYIAHSWNCDSRGNHVDFTFNDPENFEYCGVVVPEVLIWKVVKKNRNRADTVLPFLKNF